MDPNSPRAVVERTWGSEAETDPVLKKKRRMDVEPKVETEGIRCSSRFSDPSVSVGAKAKLHELCALKHWKSPVFECCEEEGPSHMKSFTYKVKVELGKSSSSTILECYGEPQTKKQKATESAAEGALWCLKILGHFPIKKEQH